MTLVPDRAARTPILTPHIVGPRRPSRKPAIPARPEAAHRSAPLPITVSGIERTIEIKIATEWGEWEQAFELVAASYRARGYEVDGTRPFRFTPYHVLPDTVTLIAKHEGRVVATLSLVPDTSMLGLPMEGIYGEEIAGLRQEGRKLAEVISLADSGLSVREFVQVFKALIKLEMQYHASRGGDTWVIAINPRHRSFYQKVMGFVPLGPCRSYPSVQDHPAEAYWLDLERMRTQAPKMHLEAFGERLPDGALEPPPWSAERVRHFGHRSTQIDTRRVDELVLLIEHLGSPPRWQENGEWSDRSHSMELDAACTEGWHDVIVCAPGAAG
jgi:N-acyl amino acid synthase FeeM